MSFIVVQSKVKLIRVGVRAVYHLPSREERMLLRCVIYEVMFRMWVRVRVRVIKKSRTFQGGTHDLRAGESPGLLTEAIPQIVVGLGGNGSMRLSERGGRGEGAG